jgi:hypothetical protein
MRSHSFRSRRGATGASLVVFLVFACAVAYAAVPAFGNYECTGGCKSVTGPNATIHTVFGQNKSGGGNCTNYWKYNGGSNYNLEEQDCVEGTTQGFDCEDGPHTAHGETANGTAGYLWGSENDSRECI